jgi:hypothetical protein
MTAGGSGVVDGEDTESGVEFEVGEGVGTGVGAAQPQTAIAISNAAR